IGEPIDDRSSDGHIVGAGGSPAPTGHVIDGKLRLGELCSGTLVKGTPSSIGKRCFRFLLPPRLRIDGRWRSHPAHQSSSREEHMRRIIQALVGALIAVFAGVFV